MTPKASTFSRPFRCCCLATPSAGDAPFETIVHAGTELVLPAYQPQHLNDLEFTFERLGNVPSQDALKPSAAVA